jgi:hypothetical protein
MLYRIIAITDFSNRGFENVNSYDHAEIGYFQNPVQT